ncbi:quinone-dependent dihydroorotate dehydrogenase [Flavilitoribacter nigricans]|uniref:Dihydroorotate dehydrogenase (quinone) n=1 Tax=Flavilitoribacter nigricans (strain ATCC 23147 / DSM 23189 / NBRC 102662 / NCIMB 1420 / SS-2) TaxID=1122177 RepID=A0A2D0NAJ0_FLAN2|nr:quinone-dependent dihydroorotate dehydrogenase [Flavilitoribacter nigricans]PHN05532.1 dihydroorotate dehydrogenase (quinone) [Flavilitoribacter nigricans DSM 23189 = NBRC 102662]
MYKSIIKPIFFLFPAERAHHLTLFLLKMVLGIPLVGNMFRMAFSLKDTRLEREVFGLKFPNPVGLAAGFDKDGKHFRAMSALGFGFIEVGTVTPKGQDGNPLPRLFRLPADEALINRMGFNNEGVDALVSRLKQGGKPQGLIIGGNIGKNKVTPNEEATNDYVICFEALFPYVDYFVVNVSSPNTPNLRALQDKEPLTQLLSVLQEKNRAKTAPKPILLKIAPDLTDSQLDDIIEIVENTGIDGVIATNTTISRADLDTDQNTVETIGAGGLSGQPVKDRSTEVIRYLHQKSGGKITIIGVGGIASGADALEKLEAGASLVQVYSGLIYEGPALVKNINKAILNQT